MKNNIDKIQTAGESETLSYKDENGSCKNHSERIRQISSMDNEKEIPGYLVISSHHRKHNHSDTSQPQYVHDITSSPSLFSHTSETDHRGVTYLQNTTPHRRDEEEYAALVSPKSSISPSPPASASAPHSPHLHHKRPFTPPFSTFFRPPVMRRITQSPHTTSNSRYVYPSWDYHRRRRRRYENDSDYDYCKQEQYCNLPFPETTDTSDFSLILYSRSIDANPHYSYTFDRYCASNDESISPSRSVDYRQRDQCYSPHCDHEGIDQSPQASPSKVRTSGKEFQYLCPRDECNDEYDDYEIYDDENDAHPLLRGYNPDFDGYRTASSPRNDVYKEYSNIDIEDTARTPRMPDAASEVDFDVMKPPVTPIIQPTKEPLCISPENLNQYDVLLGRGGAANSQIGNRHFRSLVQDFQPIYLTLRRKDKPLLARSLVLIVRNRGGRFLKKGKSLGEYYEAGDEKAETKASQALREGLKIRSITRKRKEIFRQQQQIEKKREKVMRYGQLGGEGEGQGGGKNCKSLPAEEQTLSHESLLNEDDCTPNNDYSSPIQYVGENFHHIGAMAFQSSPQYVSTSSTGASSSTTTIGEYLYEQDLSATAVPKNKNDQREGKN
mmetsp:Transcript_60543/g.89819  ORF Transcript_60543/g.89819 Transcript_60543/m.89819 type:complete len:610 (+) Transcript_60543:207-2036(+)